MTMGKPKSFSVIVDGKKTDLTNTLQKTKVLDKDALEVGKEISSKISNKMELFGNGISEKWASLINSVKVNQSPKISKDTPVEDLKLMWVELNSAAEREAA